MSDFKRLLDDGSEMDRMLLSAGLDEPPPARSLHRTLGALGLGGATLAGTTAVGAAVSHAAAASAATATTATATTATATTATSTQGVAIGLFAKLACGLALGGSALGGGYWMASYEADERARLELEAAAAAPRDSKATNDRVRLPHEATGNSAPTSAGPSAEDAKVGRDATDDAARRTSPTSTASAALNQEALGGEVALLDQAHAALQAGDVNACLARLHAYESRYPDGQMKAEAAELRARAQK